MKHIFGSEPSGLELFASGNRDHELPPCVALAEHAERSGNLGQLETLLDDRLDLSGLDQLSQRIQVGAVRLRHEEDRLLGPSDGSELRVDHVSQRADEPVALRAAEDDHAALRSE